MTERTTSAARAGATAQPRERPISGIVPRGRMGSEAAALVGQAEAVWRRARDAQAVPSIDAMPDRRRSHAAGVVLMLGAAALWSTGGVGIKALAMPALSLAGWRGLFALSALSLQLAVYARRAGPASRAPFRARWVWIGAMAYAVMNVTFVVATKLTTSASAMFIRYTAPVFVALLSWPLLRERVTRRQVVGCAGVVVGILCVFRDSISPTARLGNALALVAAFGAAALPLALRADQKALAQGGALRAASVSPALAVTAGNFLGVLACVPAMAAAPPHGLAQWAIIAALGLGQIGLAYVCFTLAVPNLTALETS